MNIQKRALEIEKIITDNVVNNHADIGVIAFISFLTSNEMNGYEQSTLQDIIEAALSAPFEDRHKPINALVRRAIEWQAERLARLENE